MHVLGFGVKSAKDRNVRQSVQFNENGGKGFCDRLKWAGVLENELHSLNLGCVSSYKTFDSNDKRGSSKWFTKRINNVF